MDKVLLQIDQMINNSVEKWVKDEKRQCTEKMFNLIHSKKNANLNL